MRFLGKKSGDRGTFGRVQPWMIAFVLTGCELQPFALVGGAGGSITTSSTMSITGCTMEKDCDDGNPCTIDTCKDGVCSYAFAPSGTPCPDTNKCNGAETCDGQGLCVAGTPEIDDGDPCTLDLCDAKSGEVTHPTSPACGVWDPLPSDGAPFARVDHTAIWTGSEMIVWGGDVDTQDDPAGVTATGARYDPVAKKWTAMSTTNAPPPRHSHAALWTGSKMIVWGGYGTSGGESTGGAYDPATDTWTALSTAGAPPGRVQFSSVWTGAEMIVWGGLVAGSPVADGAAYDAAADAWTALPFGPTARFDHGGAWTGSQMIVWGGNDLINWHSDGQLFDPATDAWTGATSSASAPAAREGHVSLWTGSQMLVWGGFDGGTYLDTGAALDPAAGSGGTWTAITQAGAPSGRQRSAAVWAGSQMMVWGGCGGDSCFTTLDDGGLWIPGDSGGSWKAIEPKKVASARIGATAVWTGTDVIVWGGKAGLTGKLLNDGAQNKP